MPDYFGDPTLPRGIRNNNPGNLRHVPAQLWVGELEPDPQGFCVFANPVHGLRAMYITFRTYQEHDGINTPDKMISRYAPAVENRTCDYVLDVCQRAGLTPNHPFDVRAYAKPWLRAVTMHENGIDPYSDSLYTAALLAASRR